MGHSKDKLEIGQLHDDGSVYILSKKSEQYICSVQIKQIGGGGVAEAMESMRYANAERLILCWNSHDALLKACAIGLRIAEWTNKIRAKDIDRANAPKQLSDDIKLIEQAIAEAEKEVK